MKYPKTRKKAQFGTMTCADCPAVVERRSALQKYCIPCSEVRDLARKQRWSTMNGKRLYDETRAKYAEKGSELNEVERLDINTSLPRQPNFLWYRRVEVPFSWAGSKNHIFSSTREGHVFMRAESRYMREHLTLAVSEALVGQEIAHNKIWLDIFVQKPRQNGDAVNFVDMVCDAVKDALPVDDRWFCISSVDWQIVKREPKLFVGIGQETALNVRACSSCGRLLPYEEFQRNKSDKHGIGRNCRECQATKRSSKKRDNSRAKALIKDNPVGAFA